MTNKRDERVKFEKWIAERFPNAAKYLIEKFPDGEYRDATMRVRYETWQASRAATQGEAVARYGDETPATHYTAPPQPEVGVTDLDGDLFWDYNDGELCENSIEGLLAQQWADGVAEHPHYMRVQRAKKLPDLYIVSIEPKDEDGSLDDYEVISKEQYEAAIGAQGEG